MHDTSRQTGPRNFFLAWAIGWAILVPVAFAYTGKIHLPAGVSAPAAAAFLLEYIFYLVPGFPSIRERFAGRRLGPALILSMLLPYLVYAVPAHFFALDRFLVLTAISATIAYWYSVFSRIWWSDSAFVVSLASLLLSPLFRWIYPDPARHVSVFVLGHLFLIHAGAMVMLVDRRFPGIGFGFVPYAREWKIGTINFLWFIPVGGVLAAALHAFGLAGRPIWQAPLVFAGYFLVVALGEEFAFRGVLQHSLQTGTGSPRAALILTSLCFGVAHLWFGGNSKFPNWRMMVLASAAGWFYGRAYQQANGIRAAMVAHTLVVTVWLVWLY